MQPSVMYNLHLSSWFKRTFAILRVRKPNDFLIEPISKVMEIRFGNDHPAKCRSSVEGAVCKVTPDTGLRQVDYGRFKDYFQDF